jgi:hypothetical protein
MGLVRKLTLLTFSDFPTQTFCVKFNISSSNANYSFEEKFGQRVIFSGGRVDV